MKFFMLFQQPQQNASKFKTTDKNKNRYGFKLKEITKMVPFFVVAVKMIKISKRKD